MAIEMLKGPDTSRAGSAGKFDLPLDFDTKAHAAEWVNKKDVEGMRGRQRLMGIPATADGWTVWKDKNGKICEVDTREGKWTLMYRPKVIQQAVNVLYGNLGKENARFEQEGASVAGSALQDPGMLPEKRLRGLGLAPDELERNEAQFQPTPIPHIGAPSNGHVDATRET